MNTRQEIVEDLEKMEYLLEYMTKIKKYAILYLRIETEDILKKKEGENWYVLPKDRIQFAQQLYQITRTQAVADTVEDKLIRELDLEGFYSYCEMIQKQVDKVYLKYFRSRLYRKGKMVCSRICGTWDPKKEFWYTIQNGKRILSGKFPAP